MEQGIRIIREGITRSELADQARHQFGDMVKAVVDVQRKIMAVGGELHSDEEAALLDDGSKQADLWGINLYPGEPGSDWIEFDSMINVRPAQGNRSRTVEAVGVKEAIRRIVPLTGGRRMTAAAGHAGLASGAWSRLTIVEQMANVGSEVERAIRAHESGRTERRDQAIARALELFDLIGADERWRGARRRETRRAREEFCRLFYGDDVRPGEANSLQKYFLQFAVAARQPKA